MMGDLGKRRVVATFGPGGIPQEIGTYNIEGPDATGGFFVYNKGREIPVVLMSDGYCRLVDGRQVEHLKQ